MRTNVTPTGRRLPVQYRRLESGRTTSQAKSYSPQPVRRARKVPRGPAGTKIVTIDRDRSRVEVVSTYAPANASGDSVPGGRGIESAVCWSGRTGVEGASNGSADGVPDACIPGKTQPASSSGIVGEVRAQPATGIPAARMMVSEMTAT